jgi:hypothetical protein
MCVVVFFFLGRPNSNTKVKPQVINNTGCTRFFYIYFFYDFSKINARTKLLQNYTIPAAISNSVYTNLPPFQKAVGGSWRQRVGLACWWARLAWAYIGDSAFAVLRGQQDRVPVDAAAASLPHLAI